MDSRSLRDLVIDYLGRRCTQCGATNHLVIHHTTPLYVGGRNEMANVEVVCSTCHALLHIQWMKLHPYSPQDNKSERMLLTRAREASANADEELAHQRDSAIEGIKELIKLGIMRTDDLPSDWQKMTQLDDFTPPDLDCGVLNTPAKGESDG